MKTKVVYVLTTSEKDFFLEEACLSAYSLKLHNPDCLSILVMDTESRASLVGMRANAIDFFDDIIAVDSPDGYNKKEVSRWLKTSLRDHIQGDFLYIDTDTIIVDDISIIDQCCYDVAAVIDRHSFLEENPRYKFIMEQWRAAKVNYSSKDSKYFNGGVMYVKDSPNAYALYSHWLENWKRTRKSGINIDMPALAQANQQMGYIIQELDGVWNCQICANGLRYLNEARIIHYFNANFRGKIKNSPYLFSDLDIFLQIRKDNYKISKNLSLMIKSAKSQFALPCELMSDIKLKLQYEAPLQFIYEMYSYHRNVYVMIDKLCDLYYNMMKKL